MPQSLNSLYPDAEEVLSLAPAALGQIMLSQFLVGDKPFNRQNLNGEMIRGYGVQDQTRVSRAAMEALSWLDRQALIAESDQTGWYFVTQEGRRFSQNSDASGSSITNANVSVEREENDEQPALAEMNGLSELDEPDFRTETIFRSGISDQAARNDALGFEPYVRAIADFLTDINTEPPLTLSVEGEWGSGKSSFMLQLKELLKDRGNLTVTFNAWRHEKADELWAAFALDFVRQISKEQPFWHRWWANLKLRWRRYDWTTGTFDILRTIATFALLVTAGAAVPLILLIEGWDWSSETAKSIVSSMGEKGDIWTGVINWVLKIGGGSAVFVIAATLWLKLKNFIGNPITFDLKKHLKSPNYEERVAFVERFHRDLEKIVRCYVGKRKVYIFIDDLDRCDVPKAADLMQAINLMIANDPNLVFIVGMDREKIAAGLAIKYEKLLPYLDARSSSTPFEDQLTAATAESVKQNRVDAAVGLEFGYRFIEKFIQLPFRIPLPAEHELKQLLQSFNLRRQPQIGRTMRVIGVTKEVMNAVKARVSRKTKQANLEREVPQLASVDQSDRTENDNRQSLPQRKQILNLISGESETDIIQRIVAMVVPILGYNPRRVKQFLNLFRLKAHIANETGLFDSVEGSDPDEKTLTLEQLGKFVALSQMYPRLLIDLDFDRQLLKKLDLRARKLGLAKESDFTAEVLYWEQRKDVMDLISHGIGLLSSPATARYGLDGLNVDKLLQVSPYVPRQPIELNRQIQVAESLESKDSITIVRQPEDEPGREAADVSTRFRLVDPSELLLPRIKAELERRNLIEMAKVLDSATSIYTGGDELLIEFPPEASTALTTESLELLQGVIRNEIDRDITVRPIFNSPNRGTSTNQNQRSEISELLDPELELLQAYFTDVEKRDSGRFERVSHDTVAKVASLDFDLKPVQGSVPWVEVRVQIVFNYGDNKRTNAINGIWRDRDSDEMPFRPGEVRTLFVASYSPERGFYTYEFTGRSSAPLEKSLGRSVRVQVRTIGKYMDNPRMHLVWCFRLSEDNERRLKIEQIPQAEFDAGGQDLNAQPQ
jgi:hypothetical protein